MALNCDPKYLENFRKQAKKENYDPDKLSEVERRVRRLSRMAEASRGKYVTDVKARIAAERAAKEHLFSQQMGEVIDLKGVDYNGMESWLSNVLGLRLGDIRGISATATQSVRQNLLNATRIASGLIDETARYVGMKKVKEHTKSIDDVLRKYGVSDARQRASIRMESIEIGTFPKYESAYNLGEAGKAYLRGRYNKFVEELEGLGLSPEDIDEIVESAYSISASMDEVRVLANSLGLNVGKVEGIGYFTRVFTPEVSRFIDAARRQGRAFGEVLEQGQGFSLNTNMASSRSTFNFIPEDLTVLSQLTDTPVEDVTRIINEGNITKWLHNNVSKQTLEEMVDTGVLSKIPMTTKEVADYIATQFSDLPYKGMSDLFLTDPDEVFDFYVNNLQESAKMSSMAKTIVREGMEKGWVVPESMRQADDLFSSFKEIDAQTIREYFPQYKGTEKLYMHPIVENTWKSVLKVSGDPRFMNTFSQHVNYWGGLLSNAMLIHPAYAARVLWDSSRAMVSAGGNFMRSFEGMFDVVKLWNSGFDNLDDTVKRYRGLDGGMISERELMRQFIRMRGGSLVPGVANMRTGNVGKALKDLTDISQMGKSVNYAFTYLQNFGGKEAASFIADGIKGKQADLFAPIASIANFFEVGMKWATIKSLADSGDDVGRFFLGGFDVPPQFDNLRDIFTHVDDYFLAWDDAGTASKAFSVLQPFAAYSMANPPAQIRQAMRRPREFMNYYRIKSFMFGSSDSDDPDLNEATVPHWMLQNSPLGFKKTGENEFITLLSGSFDARADGFNFIHESSEALARDMGWWIGSSTEQREKIENEMNGRSSLFRMFSEQMARSHTLWQNAAEIATGVDIRTGRPIEQKALTARDSFLGVNMPVAMRYLLSSYPILSRIDRSNPGGIFGEPEIRDTVTGEIINEGRPSIFGAARTDSNRIERYAAGQYTDTIRTAAWLGLDLRIVDVARNLQWTTSDVKRVRDELNSTLSKTRQELTAQSLKGTEDVEFQRRLERYNDEVERLIYLEFEYQSLIGYMNDKGIPPKNFFEDIEKEAVREYIQNGGSTPVDDILINSIEKYQPLFIGENGRTN